MLFVLFVSEGFPSLLSQWCGLCVGTKWQTYMISQSLPQLSVNERNDSAGIFWCAAVVLTRIPISFGFLS